MRKIVKANKYHTDTGFRYRPTRNPKTFKLTNKLGLSHIFPRIECKLFFHDQGNVEIHMNGWLYDKEKEFLEG